MKTKMTLWLEWAFWLFFISILWGQTGAFSEPIAEYKFGASGWPKMVLLGLFVGASGQLLLGLLSAKNAQISPAGHTKTDDKPSSEKHISRWQQLAIFGLPFLYLYIMHRIGFFVATPVFILAYLWVLEVRGWKPLLGVSVGVTLFIFVLFVRVFYVALPVGAWLSFYEINNQIIVLLRYGL